MLVLSYKPRQSDRIDDIKFSKVADNDKFDEFVNEMSEEFDLNPEDIRDVLRRADKGPTGAEFDAMRFTDDGKIIYYESKAGRVKSGDIKEKFVRFKAYARLDPDIDVENIEFVLVTRKSDEVPDIVGSVDWASHHHHPWAFRPESTSQPSLSTFDGDRLNVGYYRYSAHVMIPRLPG